MASHPLAFPSSIPLAPSLSPLISPLKYHPHCNTISLLCMQLVACCSLPAAAATASEIISSEPFFADKSMLYVLFICIVCPALLFYCMCLNCCGIYMLIVVIVNFMLFIYFISLLNFPFKRFVLFMTLHISGCDHRRWLGCLENNVDGTS